MSAFGLLVPPGELEIEAGQRGERTVARIRLWLVLLLSPIPILKAIEFPHALVDHGAFAVMELKVDLVPGDLAFYLVVDTDFDGDLDCLAWGVAYEIGGRRLTMFQFVNDGTGHFTDVSASMSIPWV